MVGAMEENEKWRVGAMEDAEQEKRVEAGRRGEVRGVVEVLARLQGRLPADGTRPLGTPDSD